MLKYTVYSDVAEGVCSGSAYVKVYMLKGHAACKYIWRYTILYKLQLSEEFNWLIQDLSRRGKASDYICTIVE